MLSITASDIQRKKGPHRSQSLSSARISLCRINKAYRQTHEALVSQALLVFINYAAALDMLCTMRASKSRLDEKTLVHYVQN